MADKAKNKSKNNIRNKRREEIRTNRAIAVFFIACVAVLFVIFASSAKKLTALAGAMPVVSAITAFLAAVCFAADGILKKKGKRGEKTVTFGFVGAILCGSLGAELLLMLLDARGYVYMGDAAKYLCGAIGLALLVYTAYIACTVEYAVFASVSVLGFVALFVLRDVQGSSIKFPIVAGISAFLQIAVFIAVSLACQNGGKLFSKKVFAKNSAVFPYAAALVTSLLQTGAYVLIPKFSDISPSVVFAVCVAASAVCFAGITVYFTVRKNARKK